MKERYSIGRRAFGPSEFFIRNIVNSCSDPDCRFSQVVHSRQQPIDEHRNSFGSPGVSVSNVDHNLTNLLASRIQDQLETAGIGAVSPPDRPGLESSKCSFSAYFTYLI